MSIDDHTLTVISADGNDISPVEGMYIIYLLIRQLINYEQIADRRQALLVMIHLGLVRYVCICPYELDNCIQVFLHYLRTTMLKFIADRPVVSPFSDYD